MLQGGYTSMAAFEVEDLSSEPADAALVEVAARPRVTYYRHSKSAKQVACALIGSCEVVHEIFYDGKKVYYYANGVAVPREVYMDSMGTAERDTYCPSCAQAMTEAIAKAEAEAEELDALPMGDGQKRGEA